MNEAVDTTPLPTLVAVRPMVLLSGFLGAGKTTLLRECLRRFAEHEHLADVILNDRENPEIDCETLRDHGASVSALAGSCLCCEGLDELAGLVLQCSKTGHDALFVELNGTADPIPLLETFTLLESRFLMRPRWQVCVVDARRFGGRKGYSGLEELQLETASHFALSHVDVVSKTRLEEVREQVRAINPRASETDALALAKNLADAVSGNRRVTVAPTEPRDRVSTRPLTAPLNSSPRHHLAHEFTGCQILLPEPMTANVIRKWLDELPESVIRAKALVRTVAHPESRHLFERVGNEVGPVPLKVPISGRVPASVIMIGAELDPPALLQSAQRELGRDCVLG